MIRAPCGRRAGPAAALLGAALLFWAPPAGADDAAAPEPLRSADIVILGEIHDNPYHHRRQAALVTALDPSAVVFEMLTTRRAATLRALGAAPGAEVLAERLGWDETGWPDFAMYHRIVVAAEDVGARIYGAELDRDRLRAAVSDGAAAVFGDAAARFGLDAPLDEVEQDRREALQMAAHCDALPEDLLPGMVAAQRLRDAHLARVALEARAETGGRIIVITGNGHARTDWGVPAVLGRAAPDLRVAALGQIEEGAPVPDMPFDVVEVTPTIERPDPCAAFSATN